MAQTPMMPNQNICWNWILLSKLLATAPYIETQALNAIFFLKTGEPDKSAKAGNTPINNNDLG